MSEAVVLELVKTLGVGAPLVAFLYLQLRDAQAEREKSSHERREITTRFLATLESTITQNTAAQTKSSEGLIDLTAAMREALRATTEEHNRLIDAIGKLGRRDA